MNLFKLAMLQLWIIRESFIQREEVNNELENGKIVQKLIISMLKFDNNTQKKNFLLLINVF